MTVTLAIVVCGPQLEVALRGPSHTVASLVRLAGISPRSTLVLAAADLLVEDAGLEPSAIERVVVSRGPGSFTGIRAGIATAQGLAAATGAEIIALRLAARPGGAVPSGAPRSGRRSRVAGERSTRGCSRFPAKARPCRSAKSKSCRWRRSAIADRGSLPDSLDLGEAESGHPGDGAPPRRFSPSWTWAPNRRRSNRCMSRGRRFTWPRLRERPASCQREDRPAR